MNLTPSKHWEFFRCERCHENLGLVALGRFTMWPERAECIGDDLGLVVRCKECGHQNTWHGSANRN